MLLWELAFEKIPYENWNVEKIKEWVLSGKRERLVFGRDKKPEIEELQKEFKQIIVAGKYKIILNEPDLKLKINY